jgi:hypothetical protein
VHSYTKRKDDWRGERYEGALPVHIEKRFVMVATMICLVAALSEQASGYGALRTS